MGAARFLRKCPIPRSRNPPWLLDLSSKPSVWQEAVAWSKNRCVRDENGTTRRQPPKAAATGKGCKARRGCVVGRSLNRECFRSRDSRARIRCPFPICQGYRRYRSGFDRGRVHRERYGRNSSLAGEASPPIGASSPHVFVHRRGLEPVHHLVQ